LKAGKVFATSDNGEFKVEKDSVILFPKPQDKIQKGMEACLMAECA